MNRADVTKESTDVPDDQTATEPGAGPESGPGPGEVLLHRQAHRVLMAAFHGTELPDWLHDALRDGLGSVCLFGSNLTGRDDQAKDLIHQLHAASLEGCLIALDEEGGDVTRLDAVHGSEVAGHAVLGAVDDVDLTRAVATGIGRRLAGIGIDLDLGPVADVNCEPDNPVIGVRSFGADPQLVARHVTAFTEGLQASGVAACLKHFPGHGATVEDSHLAAPRLDLDVAGLCSRELVPFAAAVTAGAAAVMTSHVVVTALDPGRPATTSPPVLRLLREELGFDGVIVADALDMAGVALLYGGSPAAAVASLAAGVDLLCLGPERTPGDFELEVPNVVAAIVSAVRDGLLPAERLAQAAGRVERLIAVVETGALPHQQFSRDLDPGGTGTGLLDADPSRIAARRALRTEPALTTGPTTPQGGPSASGAIVVEFDVTPGIAAGVVPWGLARHLAEVLPGIDRLGASADKDVSDYLTAAADRPVIALVRDAHRHPWVGAQLAELARARPDLSIVETGWPIVDEDGTPTGLPAATTRVWTYGGSAVSLRAVAAFLAGQPLEAARPIPRPSRQGGTR
jgi:beta-N-acetylhexosaminidase